MRMPCVLAAWQAAAVSEHSAGPSGPYQFPAGHHMARCFPVEGDPFVEVWFGEEAWGQVDITDIDHSQVGDARVSRARFVVAFYPPPQRLGTMGWQFDMDEVDKQLTDARQWLLDNERGRVPVEADGLTAAGQAFSKISIPDQPQGYMPAAATDADNGSAR
jgi:hypothetical protein